MGVVFLKNTRLDISYLSKVLNSTIEAVEKGQKEIFDIEEHSKRECERLERELEAVKRKVEETIRRVDSLEKLEKDARFRLMMVSRDFKKYKEEDIKAAYEEAKDIQVKLSLEKEREVQLREKRDDLERSFRSMLIIFKQAEHLTMQVGVALSFLKGNLEDISGQLTDVAQKQSFAARIIKAQEEERRRVARDIHDGPCQTMANIIIQTELCEKLFEKDIIRAKKEMEELKQIVRESLRELRKIIFNLRPSALDDLGLEAVVKSFCSEFQEETGIQTQFKMFGNRVRMDSSIELTLYRIIQEALTNIKKHARAKNALIKLEISQDLVNLTVADDGIGFVVNSSMDGDYQDHFGLLNIKERTELLDGSINIVSAPGLGTKIFITIPIKEENIRGNMNGQ